MCVCVWMYLLICLKLIPKSGIAVMVQASV